MAQYHGLTNGLNEVDVTPDGELNVKPPSQTLFDQHFNEIIDDAIWFETEVGTGTISVADSTVNLQTLASGDAAQLAGKQSFTHVFSKTISFKSGIILDNETLTGNTRSWGMYNTDTDDGWYFRILDGVLQACTINQGVVTATSIDTYKPVDGNVHRYDAIYRNYRVVFIIDGETVHTSSSTLTPLYDNEGLAPYFRNDNTSAAVTVDFQLEGMSIFDDSSTDVTIAGKDGLGLTRPVAVSSTGRLLVSNAPPDSPPETTSVTEVYYDGVAGTDDQFYIIPSGSTIVIQRISSGSEVDSTAGNVTEFWDDVNGDQTLLLPIEIEFTNGSSADADTNYMALGDGVRQILIRRRRLSGGNKLMFAKWEGYLQ